MVPCAECGYENVPGTLFCEACGNDLTVAAESPRRETGDVPQGVASRTAVDVRADAAVEAPIVADPVGNPAPVAANAAAPAGVAAPAVGAAYLVSESGRRVDVPAQEIVIVGREDMRSGIRPDVDLTLDGASAAGVSRRHCRLLRQEDGWYIEDLMSTNFTVLNGTPLTAHTPARLHDGDEVRVGKMRLHFHQP